MKKKLTLTVQDKIIESAKRQAKRRGISVSQMFEEMFAENEATNIQTEAQKAAKRLLQSLEKSDSITSKKDKRLIKEHVKRKFA